MDPVVADKALFIKLGEGGRWEAECIRTGTLRFGYREVPHELCAAGNWAAVEGCAQKLTHNQGAAVRHVGQIRNFYEAPPSTLWITFHADRLWWCFADQPVRELPGNDKERLTRDGWRDHDIHDAPLLKGKLSGRLLAVQGFMGTICTVSELQYLLHKINGTVEPHVAVAQNAFEALQTSLVPIIERLHHKDFETLTDLIFRQSGWQRVGVSGGTEKDIDLDLIQPVTGERIAVQVKSRAKAAVWRDYRNKYADMRGFSRFYFVTHSPGVDLRVEASRADDPDFLLWDAQTLAAQAIRGGLTGWLLDKAS